jgi:RNA polymerase sigma factor (sigma-70 family)
VALGSEATEEASWARFSRLYEEQSRPLLGYALRRVQHPEDAADVVAETMLVALRRIDDVPRGGQARLWLFGVARRVLANHHRGRSRQDRLGERLRADLCTQLRPDELNGVETTLVLRAALDRLAEDDREILRLTAWEGLSPNEAAVVVGIPAVTARSRLLRARRRVRRELAALGWPGEHLTPVGAEHVEEPA